MNASASRVSRKGRRITVSLPEQEHAVLSEMAERHDVSISWFARKAISEFIDKYYDAQTQLPLLPGK